MLSIVWNISPLAALSLGSHVKSNEFLVEMSRLVKAYPIVSLSYPEAIQYLVTQTHVEDNISALKFCPFWAASSAIMSISYFLPQYKLHPSVFQYCLLSLCTIPIESLIFYIPQAVQALRYDVLEYLENFIICTARTTQVFAHQIILNMKANAYTEDGNVKYLV
jgi:phosphatidylinositol 4-kinase